MKNDQCLVHIRPKLKIFKGYPDLAPFFCVFFILLFFFMMGSNFVRVQGIRVSLPQAVSETVYAAKNLIITIDQDSNLYFNDFPADNVETLKRRIAEVLSSQEGIDEILIRCDRNAKHETVIKIMEIAEELNLNAVFMVDDPVQKKTNFGESDR